MNDRKHFPIQFSSATRAISLTLAATLIGSSGCGAGSDDGDGGNSAPSIAAAAAPTIGVTSPTARSSSSMTSVNRIARGLRVALEGIGSDTEIPDSIPIDELNETLEENLAEDTAPEAIVEQLPATPFGDIVYRAACFGPSLRTVVSSVGTDRPIGDLGIFYRTKDDTTDEACASAQISALLGGDPANANSAILIVQAAVKAYADANGVLPTEEADIVDLLPVVTGISFTSATLAPLSADADGRVGYHTSIVMDIDGVATTIDLWQTPTSDDNSSYKGLLQLVSAHYPTSSPSTAMYRGLSMLFEESGDDETYVIETAANRETTSTDFFDATSGRVDFESAAAGELLNKMIVTQNTGTGAMTLHYAWQAGAGDGATRAFAAQVTGTGEGDSGIAWYGYGDAMAALSDDTSTIWPEKMYCNWTSGLAGGASQAKLQQQVLTRGADSQDESGGLVFIPDADDNWVYAPTDACTHGSPYTVTNPSIGPPAPAFIVADTVNHSGDSNLVDVPAGDGSLVDAVTIPEYSKP